MCDQSELNIICPIKPAAMNRLREKLAEFDHNLASNRVLPFDKLNTIHFARWVILDATTDLKGAKIEPQLLLALDFDGDQKSFLEVFTGACKKDLCDVYGCCEGFPDNAWANHAAFVAYLQSHHVKTLAGFSGHPRKSLVRIYREGQLRTALTEFLDQGQSENRWHKKKAVDIHQDVQSHLMLKTKYHWVFQSSDPDIPAYRKYMPELLGLTLVVFLTATKSWWLFLAILVLFFSYWVRLETKHQPPSPFSDPCPNAAGFQSQEDFQVQNQLTSVTYMKPGKFYLISVRIMLWIVNLLARYKFIDGYLDGIGGIHFARWILIDEGRRLLFISNFDGSWQNYLGDFIDQGALGLTAIWIHTAGFPRLKKYQVGGAWNECAFKAYARASQVTTQFWYSAYKHLSVTNINNHSKIRKGVAEPLVDKKSVDEKSVDKQNHWMRFL